MNSIKYYTGKIKGNIGYIAMTTSLILAFTTPNILTHTSGFTNSYYSAIARNTNTKTEELSFRQDLIKEISKRSKQGKNLDDTIDWLNTK